MPKFVIYSLAIFGAVFSIVASYLLYSQVLRGRKQSEAEILSVDVESFKTQNDDQVYTAYRAKYQVRFSADGRSFQLPVSGNLASLTADEARAKAGHNPVGSRRPVYYLPGRPEDILLDPPARRFGFCLLLLSIGLSILAGSVLLWRQAQPLEW